MREKFTWLRGRREVWEARRAPMEPDRRRHSFDWRQLISYSAIVAVFTAGGRYWEVQQTKRDLTKVEKTVEEKHGPAIIELEKKDIEIRGTLESIEKEVAGVHKKLDELGKRMTMAIISAREARRRRIAEEVRDGG